MGDLNTVFGDSCERCQDSNTSKILNGRFKYDGLSEAYMASTYGVLALKAISYAVSFDTQ